MRNRKQEFYRCHSRHNIVIFAKIRYCERWFSYLRYNIIFPVLSRLQFIYDKDKKLQNEEKECRKDARAGYQVAVDMTIKEEKLFWEEFNALLVANSILIIAISTVICKCSGMGACSQQDLVSDLPWFMAIIGLFLCILWYLSTVRRDAYRKYYLFSAKELEGKLSEDVQILRKGKGFSEGKSVTFKSDSAENKHQLPPLGLIKVPCWTTIVIILFILIYSFVLLKSLQNLEICDYMITIVIGIFFVGILFCCILKEIIRKCYTADSGKEI